MLLALINYKQNSLIKKYDVHPCPAVKNTYLHIGYIIHIVAKEKKIETKHTYLHTYYYYIQNGDKRKK